jgi:prepilin peptidase CpaA
MCEDMTIMVTEAIRLLLFPALMAFAASSDLFTMTISNRLSLALAGGFILLVLTTGMPLPAIGMHLAAGALVLVISFGFFTRGWIGGGDAKLAAATALWFGFDYLLDYLIYASLFGGALTLTLLQFRKLPLPAALARQEWIQRLHDEQGGVPYGIALAAAALAIYPKTGWLSALGG